MTVMAPERDDETSGMEKDEQWWSMSPKTQIILIAVAFGVFNLLLVAIFAAVVIFRSS